MRARIIVSVLLLLFAILPIAEAVPIQFIETFDTTTYRDAGGTWADWNTTDGQLRLRGPYSNQALAGTARDVAVAGHYAYVATSLGMSVVDISDPEFPALSGDYSWGDAYGIDVSGNYVFLAMSSEMVVVDITNPNAPSRIGSVGPYDARDVEVAGTLAYVTDMASGLLVVDITVRHIPVVIGTYSAPGLFNRLAVAGNRAYVAASSSGLVIIDVSVPASPSLLGSVSTGGNAVAVDVSGTLAVVADADSGLVTIDVTVPTSPVQLDRYDIPEVPYDVEIEGMYAYLADGTGVRNFFLQYPSNLNFVGAWRRSHDAAQGIDAGGNVYVADGVSGLSILEGAPWPNPVVTGSTTTFSNSPCVAVQGRHAYVGGSYFLTTNYIEVFDVANSYGLSAVASRSVGAPVADIAVQGNILAVATEDGSDIFWDVSDPATPVNTLFGLAGTGFESTFLSGNQAYFGNSNRMYVLDISQLPSTFVATDTVFLSQPAFDIHVDGDIAYIANGISGLITVDVSNPYFAGILDTLPTTPDPVTRVVVDGDIAYIVRGTSLDAVDVSDPSNPTVVGTVTPTTFPITDISLSGDRVFLSIPAEGMGRVIVEDPANMIVLPPTTVDSYAMTTEGHYTYVADDQKLTAVFVKSALPLGDRGRSTSVLSTTDSVYAVSLSATFTGLIDFEITPDGGSTWIAATPGAGFVNLSPFGTDLRWRCTFIGLDPTVDDITLNWRYDFPLINDVHDVPGDQGGSVHLTWYPSPREAVAEGAQITQYTVWRAIDEIPAAALKESGALVVASPADIPAETAAPLYRRSRIGGQDYFWEPVGTQQAFFRTGYSMTIPTLYDSSAVVTQKHYFQVIAHTPTPAIYYESPIDSGYSVDNLSPAAPQGVAGQASYGPAELTITWSPNSEFDLAGYNVYRGTTPDFAADASSFLAATVDTSATDSGWTPEAGYYYKIRAVDIHGNESPDAVLAPDIVSATDTPAPLQTAVDVYPNPFNPSTTIAYTVALAGDVTLSLFDVQGRQVDTLVERTWHAPGNYRVPYRANMSAGVYFLRMTAGHTIVTRKLVLVK